MGSILLLLSKSAYTAFRANTWPGSATAHIQWLALWAALFAGLTLVVQMRLLASVDETALRFVAATRPVALADAVNWIFRLGYLHVDAAVAMLWAALLLARRRSLLAALPPLVLFAAVGVQTGMRLVIDQPGPGREYAVQREFVSNPVGYVLDRVDSTARETFVAATVPEMPARGQASFLSGHAARSLFLVLLAGHELRKLRHRRALPGRHLLPAVPLVVAVLVGYSALYFGYHWPSDVLGGYLLALALYQVAAWLRDLAPTRRAEVTRSKRCGFTG